MKKIAVQVYCRRPSLGEMDALVAMGVGHLGWELQPSDGDGLTLSRRIVDRARKAGARTTLLIHSRDASTVETIANMVSPDCLLIPAGMLEEARIPELARRLAPLTSLMMSVPVRLAGSNAIFASMEKALRYQEFAGSLILDTCLDANDLQRCGCTGRTNDWQECTKIVAALIRPVILAGGLNPQNVGAAIREVRPWGVDACSSLELPDKSKDLALCQVFVNAVRAMDSSGT